jgi:YgiT-type zinc finger domain-containing protein
VLTFDECPVCAGQIIEKEVTKVISRGKQKTVLKLPGYVCCKCSEQFYPPKSIKHIEKVIAELEK